MYSTVPKTCTKSLRGQTYVVSPMRTTQVPRSKSTPKSDIEDSQANCKAKEANKASEAAQDRGRLYVRCVATRLLSSGELAKELGISRRSISRYADEGLISVALVTPGGRYKFDLDVVREEMRKIAQNRRPGD